MLFWKRTTRSLAYILESSDAAKSALQEMLRSGGADVGTIERVEAEVFGDNQGRVDLVAFDEADKERVLIEAKFAAGLTDNQPEGYLGRLPDDNEPAVLLFLAPQRRLHTLWSRLQQRAREGLELKNVKNESGDLHAATIAESNRHLMLTSWQKLLGEMGARADLAGDRPIGEDIRQLSGLCDQEDTAPFQPLRETELSPEVPRRLHDLMRLVNDATTIAVAERFANKDGKFRHSREGFGTYLRIGSEDNGVWARAWFGVEYDWWQEDEYPLWIWFRERSDTLPMSEIVQKLGYDCAWIDLPIDKEYDEVLHSVVDDLRKHARRLAGEMDDDEWRKYHSEFG